jgi:hypothetical protein
VQKPLATVVIGGLLTATLLRCWFFRRCMRLLRPRNGTLSKGAVAKFVPSRAAE